LSQTGFVTPTQSNDG